MPTYITEPSVQTFPPTTIPCVEVSAPNYSFGGSDEYGANAATQVSIVSYALVSNVVTFTVTRGLTPQFTAGRTVVVSGIASPNNFLNGSYTLSSSTSTTLVVPKTHADASSVNSPGTAIQTGTLGAEQAEPLTAATAGRQFAVRGFAGFPNASQAITWSTAFPSAPSTISVTLQGALEDIDGQYFVLDTSTNASGEERTLSLGTTRVNFLRMKVGVTTGGSSPTIIGKFIV